MKKKVAVPIKKILIIRIDRIGDFVLSLPTIKALKENFKDANITIVVSEYLKDLAESCKYINSVLVYNKNSSLLKKILFFKNLKNHSFDLTINMHSDYKIETAILAYASCAPLRVGFSSGYREIFFTNSIEYHGDEQKKSFVDIIYNLLSTIDIIGKSEDPELVPSLESEKKITIFFKESKIYPIDPKKRCFIIGLAPGGFYESQRWSVERFAKLANLIREKFNVKFIIFGSKDETELVKILNNKIFGTVPTQQQVGCPVDSPNILSVTDFSVSEIVALVSKLDLLICNNSGPLHIASALSIQTVSTMGPTDPYLWIPRGDKNIVIRKDLSCSPCNKGKCKTHECMELITVEEMFKAVETQVKKMIY